MHSLLLCHKSGARGHTGLGSLFFPLLFGHFHLVLDSLKVMRHFAITLVFLNVLFNCRVNYVDQVDIILINLFWLLIQVGMTGSTKSDNRISLCSLRFGSLWTWSCSLRSCVIFTGDEGSKLGGDFLKLLELEWFGLSFRILFQPMLNFLLLLLDKSQILLPMILWRLPGKS